MKLSGFTFVRNADSLYYPIVASIGSALPIVDEFIVAIGDCAAGDKTRELVAEINSPKIKIIDTIWDIDKYPRGMEHAHQTDIAKEACTGDWLLYLQADELIHEQDFQVIQDYCRNNLRNKEVDGFLFDYLHFYGDYKHHVNSHGWYPNEIRIIRNDPTIHSYISAQSFRRIPDFDGLSYRQKEGTSKLNVKAIPACIHHYGWVRPPRLMQKKSKEFNTTHRGEKGMTEMYKDQPDYFDYGPMKNIPTFSGIHPKAIQEWMSDFHWAEQLNYGEEKYIRRPKMKHERLKYKIISFFEHKFNGGKEIVGYSNWNLIK